MPEVDPKVRKLAQRYSYPEVAEAQWALETGWGIKSDLWPTHHNLFGIQFSENSEHQSGRVGFSKYAHFDSDEDCFEDRERIIKMYQGWNPYLGENILHLLDLYWAPQQGYEKKLREIMEVLKTDRQLYRYKPKSDRLSVVEKGGTMSGWRAVLFFYGHKVLVQIAPDLWDQLWEQIALWAAKIEQEFKEGGQGLLKYQEVRKRVHAWLEGKLKGRIGFIRRIIVNSFVDSAIQWFVEEYNQVIGKSWVKYVDRAEDFLDELIPFVKRPGEQ